MERAEQGHWSLSVPHKSRPATSSPHLILRLMEIMNWRADPFLVKVLTS